MIFEKRFRLSQEDIDKLVVAERRDMVKSVFGVGKNDVAFRNSISGKNVWQYVLWQSLLGRCFDKKHRLTRPTYDDVTCCAEWLSFGNFLEWINKEVGYSGKPVGMELDKDILIKGNKAYSPSTCCFVPKAVNSLLTDRINHRGEWPVGVSFHKRVKRFSANLACSGLRRHLGYFDTPEDAFLAYKTAKEAHIKVVALQHKASLKPAAFDSLMNWEIEP